MKTIDGLLAELEQEAETTRRVLERIPQAHLSWKPHPKSMSIAFSLTRIDSAFAGRAYAAYGGIYIAASLIWLRGRGAGPYPDLAGAALAVAGAMVIIGFAARTR